MKVSRKYLLLIVIAGLIIALDQVTKLYVHTHFRLGESIEVIGGWFNLTYVRNLGAAFGFLGGAPEIFRSLFFLTMPPVAVIAFLFILKGVENKDILQITALSSIVGGALGNYIDRLRFRYVIDFLDFHVQRHYTWPAFNVADIAIVCGMAALFYVMFKQELAERALKKSKATAKSS